MTYLKWLLDLTYTEPMLCTIQFKTKTAASYCEVPLIKLLKLVRRSLFFLQSHPIPRSTIWLNDLVNLNSNSVSWGSTPRSGRNGRVISTQLWLLHWSSRVLQSEPNHSPHYRLQGQISVGGPKNPALYLPTEINWNSFVAPWCSPSTPDSLTFVQYTPDSLRANNFKLGIMQKEQIMFWTLVFRPDCKPQFTVSDVSYLLRNDSC